MSAYNIVMLPAFLLKNYIFIGSVLYES